jgi:hypothetical protein
VPNWRTLSSHTVSIARGSTTNASGTGQPRTTYTVQTGMSAVPCGIQPLTQTKMLEALGIVFGEGFVIAIDVDLIPSGQPLYGGDRFMDTTTGATYTARDAIMYENRIWVMNCEKKKA